MTNIGRITTIPEEARIYWALTKGHSGQSRISAYFIDRLRSPRSLWVVARKLRVEYPGALYHVLNRGDRREPIIPAV